MTLSEFTLRIILIFLPGLIALIIVEQLIVHKEIKPYRFFIDSLILGFFCYLIYYPISQVPFFDLNFYFIRSLSDNNFPLDFIEILIATFLSIPLGFIISLFINRKILHRFAQKLKITKKFGELDVWSYIMNSEIPEWVLIRDIENDLMYQGWIQACSDPPEKDELFLRDVKVFTNSTAQELYSVPGLYFPRKRENITIEFPGMQFSEGKKDMPSLNGGINE
jgi:hypothetical protein